MSHIEEKKKPKAISNCCKQLVLVEAHKEKKGLGVSLMNQALIRREESPLKHGVSLRLMES